MSIRMRDENRDSRSLQVLQSEYSKGFHFLGERFQTNRVNQKLF